MSDTATQSFLASVDASNIDTSLQSQRIAIPDTLQSSNWNLIVAANAASWATQHPDVKFYWDSNTSEVVVVSENDQSISDAIAQLTPVLTDATNVQSLESSADQLLSDNGNTKRPRGEGGDEVDEGAAQTAPSHPSSFLYAESTLNTNPKEFFNPKSATQPGLQPARSVLEHRIPNDRVGLVIGAKGSTIKALKDVTGATINVEKTPDESGQMRLIRIEGTPEQIQRAKTEIDRVVSPPTVDAKDQLSESLEIPSSSVGTVIGRGGDTIRLLQMLTHCTIVMDRDQQQNADKRIVQLTGSREQIDAAKENINKLIETHSRATHDRPFDANLVLTGRAAHRTMEIKVSGSIIGMVIGKGGENLRRINQESGARINVDKEEHNATRVVTISAPNDRSLHAAERLIRDLVSECLVKKSRDAPQASAMYGHQTYFGQSAAAPAGVPGYPQLYPQPGAPAAAAAAMYGAQPYMYVQQQRLMAPAAGAASIPATVTPPAAAAAAATPAMAQLSPDQQKLYQYYYQHYIQSYPPEQAAAYAEHYLKHPPASK